jgi:glucosamine-6-phosphate deaminase
MKKWKVEKLNVKCFDNRVEMGIAAAEDGACIIKKLLSKKEQINIMFSAAPSQNEMLMHLAKDSSIDWGRINGFHMDEYIGLPKGDHRHFSKYLNDRIFSKVSFKSVKYLNGNAEDIDQECIRYSDILKEYSIDLCFSGIGENGHLAFNDPSVADFNDKKMVKIVNLEETCRQQQVNDKCFATLAEVPKRALTVTIPALMSSKYIICTVPTKSKAGAIYNVLTKRISELYPASCLRRHEHATLYIDNDAASEFLESAEGKQIENY